MIERLKEICFYIVVGFLLTAASNLLESDFLTGYLSENLITLLIALLAINTTTSSVIMTKLKEIIDASGGDFGSTVEQLKLSIYEQVAFIVIAAILLILSGSRKILGVHEWAPFVLDGLIASIFIAGLYTLFDTAKSIFVILRYENKGEK